jgi:hypothetical protein
MKNKLVSLISNKNIDKIWDKLLDLNKNLKQAIITDEDEMAKSVQLKNFDFKRLPTMIHNFARAVAFEIANNQLDTPEIKALLELFMISLLSISPQILAIQQKENEALSMSLIEIQQNLNSKRLMVIISIKSQLAPNLGLREKVQTASEQISDMMRTGELK